MTGRMRSGGGTHPASRGQAGGSRSGRAGLWILLVVAIAGLVLVMWLVPKRADQTPIAPNPAPDNSRAPLAASQSSAEPVITSPQDEPPGETKRTVLTPRVSAGPAPAAPVPSTPRPEPSPLTRQLVTSLSQLDVGHGPLTPEQAGAWKQTMQQLGEQKQAAVPAIREFLEKNVDISFDSEADRKMIGARSLRLALLDTMNSIGGPEALDVSIQVLQTTADPLEIAMIARNLEQSDPGRYRDAELNAAREALNVAASGQWDGRDIGPLLETLKQFGGADAVNDLQRLSKKWFDYAPIVLGTMPDGAGVPALIQWAKSPEGSAMSGNEIYLRMLAQSSAQYPDALSALVDQAAANRIPASAWAGIASAIAGSTLELADPALGPVSPLAGASDARKYHIAVGNQNFLDLPPPADMSADQAVERMQMVDKLLASTSNPAAVQALQNTRAQLQARGK